MIKTIRNLLLNVLVGINAFILFFLLFESRIEVPVALQVVGRSHPLLLHFPIVLLVLAWILVCFGRRLEMPDTATRRLVGALLLLGGWSAAITTVAGLLLSREGDYAGSGFLWHKWTGVALCFLSTALLWYHRSMKRDGTGYPRFFPVGMSVALAVLLVAGHFGAGLTHGEDYLFEPLRRSRQNVVDMETAVVYEDLVYPILEAKCLSCHSSGKSKGGLVLADTASLIKGGESGPALADGPGGESLLISRLLLDIDHEHRMPPKGKPQLTPDELALVQAWVAAGADFTVPLAALPAADTIRQLAIAVYGAPAAATYDFPAADAATVEKLNTPYRVIKPVAAASPALTVGFYGRSAYHEGSLLELAPVATQVVSLSLSGMPLAEADRDALKAFVNVRELLLNETPIDDGWAEVLATLPRIRTIGISGTGFTETGLAKLLDAATLREVYVWNTPIDEAAFDRLQQAHRSVRMERGYVDDGSLLLPLNDPLITPMSHFFRDRVMVQLSHPVPGVELRYTVDGTEPDSIHAPVYTEPFELTRATPVRVKGYKAGWLSSRERTHAFDPAGHSPDRVFLLHPPHPRYRGRDALALHDLASGGSNHADGKWLGFHGQPMAASLHFGSAIAVDTLALSVKQNYGSHIYPPKQLTVWGGADSTTAQVLYSGKPELFAPDQVSPRRIVYAPLGGRSIQYLRVEAEPFTPIPDGYPAAGNPSWIFVDEVLIR